MTSVSAAIARQPTTERPAVAALRRERRFFTSLAIIMTLVCFAGFAPSYYLKAQFGTPALKPLVHVHGAIFTTWMLMLIAQTSLIASGRVKLHRQLGILGAVLAVMMVVSGAAVAYVRGTTINPEIPHEAILGFLAIAFTALVVFTILISAAFYFRKNASAHKRLMMVTTSVILAAAVHRLLMHVYDPAVSPPVFFGATDLFIVAIAVYDYVSLRRIHPATLWGGLFVIVAQAASLLLAGSQTWLTFAHWLTGT
jgi:hypothetical protein